MKLILTLGQYTYIRLTPCVSDMSVHRGLCEVFTLL